jgi:large subunit ribosomal protein L25
LVKVLHDIEIEATPKDLPHRVEIDISSLASFGSQVFARDIKLPSGVELLENADEVVASVYEPKEEKIEEAPVDLSAIEVEKKGKKEEEGAVEGADSVKKE